MQIPSPFQSQRSLRLCGGRRHFGMRHGKTFVFTLVTLLAAGGLALAGWFLLRGRGGAEAPDFLTTTVWKGDYDFVVTEQGTVESGSNTELRCQVRSRGGSTTILDVLPEGTFVKEGDVVVELDPSSLLLDENAQKILVSTRELQVAQAENTLKAAEIARQEYIEGLFVSQEKLLLSELYIAERAKATAEATLESSKVLFQKNIITALQLEAAHVSLEDAQNKLDGAQTSLRTLRDLTKQKEMTLLEANIASAEANVKAQQQSLRLEQERLKDIQEQIARCTIKAPTAGQVVYANESDWFRSSSQSQFVVTPGAQVRERQVIIWLPRADDMQIRATVNEARVTLIRPGMPVSIRVDALKDETIEGIVTKVNPFAEPGGFSSGAIKKYGTTIKIKRPPSDLRIGMNAEVFIHVEQKPSALQVPVQALAETKGHFYSIVKHGDAYETREVLVSSTNDKVATIDRGLLEGDEVVLNPRNTGNLLKLPELPDASPVAMSEIKRIDPREAEAGQFVKIAGNERGGDQRKAASKEIAQADITPADMVDEYLENDANNDDKLSREEIVTMDTTLREQLITADTNGDGFLNRRELLTVATHTARQKPDKRNGHGGTAPAKVRGRGERGPAGGENAGGGE